MNNLKTDEIATQDAPTDFHDERLERELHDTEIEMLKEEHAKTYTGTDDDMSDAFEKWLVERQEAQEEENSKHREEPLKEVDEEQGREDERMREIESSERSSDAYERTGEDLRDY